MSKLDSILENQRHHQHQSTTGCKSTSSSSPATVAAAAAAATAGSELELQSSELAFIAAAANQSPQSVFDTFKTAAAKGNVNLIDSLSSSLINTLQTVNDAKRPPNNNESAVVVTNESGIFTQPLVLKVAKPVADLTVAGASVSLTRNRVKKQAEKAAPVNSNTTSSASSNNSTKKTICNCRLANFLNQNKSSNFQIYPRTCPAGLLGIFHANSRKPI